MRKRERGGEIDVGGGGGSVDEGLSLTKARREEGS